MFNQILQYSRAEKNKIVLFAFILLGLSLILYVWYFGVNIIYQDEWSFVNLVRQHKSNGLSISDLFTPHNEHRIFFPRLFYIIMLPISDMNSKFFMFVNAILVIVEFICIFSVAKKQYHFSYSKIPVWLIIIPLFVFSLRQSRNLLWGFQIAFYMTLIASIISLYFIEKLFSKDKVNKSNFILAIVFAIIATFSSGIGFLVWIGGFVQLGIKMISLKSRSHYIFGVIWLTIGVSAFFIYITGLDNSVSEKIIAALKNPIDFLHFFFALISLTSVHFLSKFAFIIGSVLFSVSVYIFYKAYKMNRLANNSFWVAIYVFSILFAVLTTLGRFELSFEFSDRARYTIFTNLYIIATFCVAYDLFNNRNFNNKFFKLLFISLVLLAIELNGIGIFHGYMTKTERKLIKEVVLNYQTTPVSQGLKNISSWLPDKYLVIVDEVTPFLDENHFNAFKP